jgi:hypothetical protein
MTRRQRLLRLAILRGDRAAELILRGQEMTPADKAMTMIANRDSLTESEQRLMDGNR